MAKFIINGIKSEGVAFKKEDFASGGLPHNRTVTLTKDEIEGWAQYRGNGKTYDDIYDLVQTNIYEMVNRMRITGDPYIGEGTTVGGDYYLEVEIKDDIDFYKYSVDLVGPDTYFFMMNKGRLDDWFNLVSCANS